MITILYNHFPPAYKAGGPVQSLISLAREMKETVGVRVICSNTDADGSVLNVVKDEWTEFATIKVFYSSKGFTSIARQIRKEKSILFINGLYSLHFNLMPLLFLSGRKIVSARGMLLQHALAQKKWKKRVYFLLWKALGLHKRCEFHATNEEEKKLIQQFFGSQTKVWTIPNLLAVPKYKRLPTKSPGTLVINTVALISPMKNHMLILRALKECRHQVVYNIYGPIKDERYWESCKKLIAMMPANITVNYFGDVQSEIVPELIAQGHVYVQPSLSENFGHSLYTALACGRPVITSHNTPWGQLKQANAGLNVDVNSKEEMLSALNWFAEMDYKRIENWSTKARDYACREVDVEAAKQQYIQMFKNTFTR